MINPNELPADHGLCVVCRDNAECPMVEMLNHHYANKALFDADDYSTIDPGAWDADAIDDPDYHSKSDTISWCPMFTRLR